jgi:ABC-type transport system involved in multi-copper enzyme maturation permease subunit
MTVPILALICFLVVAVVVFLRRWRISILGPLFRYEMLRWSRQSRLFSLRCGYAGVLLLVLYLVFASWFGWDGQTRFRNTRDWRTGEPEFISINDWAEVGSSFGHACLWAQLIAALVLTPILTAGAITEERGRRTFELLLITHLRDREIVLGKLAARISHVALILVTGLPLLGLVQLLGGLDPNLVLAAFVATLVMMVSIGSVAVWNSVRSYNTIGAIVDTYCVTGGYLIISLACVFPDQPVPWLGWFGDGNPFSVIVREYGNPGRFTPALGLFESTLRFVLFHGIAAAIFCALATRRLRLGLDRPSRRLLRILREEQTGRAEPGRRGIEPEAMQPPLWPEHADNLLWWKERWHEGSRLRRGGPILTLSVAITLMMLLACSPFLTALASHHAEDWEFLSIWTRGLGTFISCVLLLAVALIAARTFSRERSRRTLDSLLATLLDNRAILAAKTLASVVAVRVGWILLGVFWLAAVASGSLTPLALPLLIVAWLVFAVLAAEIGVWCSLASRNTLRSTIFTLAILAGISVVPPVSGWAWDIFAQAFGWPARSPPIPSLWSYCASPPMALWGLAYSTKVKGPILESATCQLMGGIMGIHAYAVIAWLVWRQLLARFGRLTGRMPVA